MIFLPGKQWGLGVCLASGNRPEGTSSRFLEMELTPVIVIRSNLRPSRLSVASSLENHGLLSKKYNRLLSHRPLEIDVRVW